MATRLGLTLGVARASYQRDSQSGGASNNSCLWTNVSMYLSKEETAWRLCVAIFEHGNGLSNL
jgi:hypothetical protein